MSIIKMSGLEVQFGESTTDDTEKKWTDKDVETIIRCCWNAAREKSVPPYIKTFEDLVKHITPIHLIEPRADKVDFKHTFMTCVMLMHKYCWSYNWSDEFLKKLETEKRGREKK
jgi:hypothetical protein